LPATDALLENTAQVALTVKAATAPIMAKLLNILIFFPISSYAYIVA